jgi:hypothetical protein
VQPPVVAVVVLTGATESRLSSALSENTLSDKGYYKDHTNGKKDITLWNK